MNDFKVFLARLVAQDLDSPNRMGAVRFNRHDGGTTQLYRLPR